MSYFELHPTAASGPCYLTAPLLSPLPHAFSTRQGGISAPPFDSLNLAAGRGDPKSNIQENFTRLCAALDLPPERLVLSQQTHTANVRVVTEADAGKGLWCPQDYHDVDALITNCPALPLVVFSADCGTLLLFDPVQNAVGAIHAGWRGCAAGIVEKTIQAMENAYGTNPADLLAALGPCIQSCCFETDSDVPEAMTAALGADAAPHLERRGAKWHVDLAGLNRAWLLRSGVLPERIQNCGLCSACHPELFWSHRKMGEQRGAQVALIALPAREVAP